MIHTLFVCLLIVYDNDKVNSLREIHHHITCVDPAHGRQVDDFTVRYVTAKGYLYHWKSVDVVECLASLWRFTVCICRNCEEWGMSLISEHRL